MSVKLWYSSEIPSKFMGVGGSGCRLAHSFGSCGLEMETLGTLHLTHVNECISIAEVNSQGFPGFFRVCGTWIGIAGLGFSVTGAGNFGFGGTVGFDFCCRLVQKVMLCLTQSINGLYRESQQYPSMRVQLKSKGLT